MTICMKTMRTVPRRLWWFTFVINFMLLIPVFVPFMAEKGLSFGEVLLTQAIFRVAMIVLEIPTGYLSDGWCRRKTMLIGAGAHLAGVAVMAFGFGFWQMALGEVMLGVACSMFSGTKSAYVYDALLTTGEEDAAAKWEGRMVSASMLAEAGAMALSGVAYAVHYMLPILIELVFCVVAVWVVWALLPAVPQGKKDPDAPSPLRQVCDVTVYALHGHPEIKWLIYYPTAVITAGAVTFWVIQPQFAAGDVAVEYRGLLLSALYLLQSFLGYQAHNIASFVGYRRFVMLMLPLCVLGIVAMSFAPGWWAVLAQIPIVIAGFVVGKPVVQTLINKRVESRIRATVLSVFGLASSVIGIVYMTLFERLQTWFDVATALQLFALAVAVIGAVPLWGLLKTGMFDKPVQ